MQPRHESQSAQSDDTEFTEPNTLSCSVVSVSGLCVLCDKKDLPESVMNAKNSNGGVLLNIAGGPAGGTAWPVCFQAQMKLTRAGDLLPMNGAKFAEKLSTAPDAKTPQLDRTKKADPEKPAGEWNSYDIVCRGDTIEVSVNGVLQNKISKCTPAAGKIGFQLEGTPFELRHVRIAPLK